MVTSHDYQKILLQRKHKEKLSAIRKPKGEQNIIWLPLVETDVEKMKTVVVIKGGRGNKRWLW